MRETSGNRLMTKSSAPGKIILFGEHAVVYGRPALAVPVTQVHADVDISDASRTGIWIDAPDVNLHAELNTLPSDHPIASVIHNFLFLARVSYIPKSRYKNQFDNSRCFRAGFRCRSDGCLNTRIIGSSQLFND